jgi:hypothetical protein
MNERPRCAQKATLTGQWYIDDILGNQVMLCAEAVGNQFTFRLMYYNARSHKARVVQDFLEGKSIEDMDWPARSPDLNPTEHTWNELQG